MTPSGIVTLLTDFGLHDPFVGVMKGVVLGRFREARLVDLTHDIAPQRVSAACYWIERSFVWFPAGTTHVVVVDPGVGTERAPLVVLARDHVFVAPDNGVLTRVLAGAPEARAFRIDPARHGLSPASATFHGRDVFAPIAAEIAGGRLSPEAVGPALVPVRLDLAEPSVTGSEWVGEVVVVDRFGNLITNLRVEHVTGPVRIAAQTLPLSRTYADVPPGAYVALINAFGNLEIARRDGDAAASLGLAAGAPVRVLGGAS